MKNSECTIEQYRGDRLVRLFTPSGDEARPWRMHVGEKTYLRTNGWVLSKILPTLVDDSPFATKVVPLSAAPAPDPDAVRPGLTGDLEELRRQLRAGCVQRAYGTILTYLSGLRTTLDAAHDDWAVAGLYQGSFDMTYFGLATPALKERGLKIAVVFDYASFRFEVWLAARNRDIQRRYWQLLARHGWPEATLVEPAVGVDAIVATAVGDGLELVDAEGLTALIERAVTTLASDVEGFLERYDPSAG